MSLLQIMADKNWTIVSCAKFCYDGHIGMDNCNVCGCTGSQLVYVPTGERYPNTENGWNQLKSAHPDVKDEDDE